MLMFGIVGCMHEPHGMAQRQIDGHTQPLRGDEAAMKEKHVTP